MPSARKDNLTPELLAKEARVVEMRDAGYTYDEIAAELGYSNRGAVSKAYWRALKRYPAERISDHRNNENMKLDEKEERLAALRVGADADMELKIIDREFKAMDHRAKLNGLYMPVKSEVDVKGGGFVPVAIPANRLPKKAAEQLEKEINNAEDDGEG